ncbi:MAG: response regulator [Bacteroidales bacterium]|nr:response regulator [Bacteroidales bacterium]
MKIASKLSAFFRKKLEPSEFTSHSGLNFWRERIFLGIMLVFAVFGLFAYIPSAIMSYRENLTYLFVFDTIVYFTSVFIFIFRNISLKIRIFILEFLLYTLGVSLLVVLGTLGPGMIWLLSVSIIAAILLGLNAAIISVVINILTVVFFAFAIYYHWLGQTLLMQMNLGGWIAVSANLVVLSSLAAIPLSILLNGLDKSLKREKDLLQMLQLEAEKLSKAKEKAEESDKLKSAFLANMSHEIRTPMNGIIGFSEIMRRENLSAETRAKYVNLICDRSYYLLRIINDIIDISKIDSKQVIIEEKKTNLNELLGDIEIMFRSQINNNPSLQIQLQFEQKYNNRESTVIMDPTKIQQVLINLVNNAIKFSDKGSVTFGFKIQNKEICFYVHDTGIGIPMEMQEVIFERFMKYNSQKDKLIEGTGLGLTISKGLVNLMGGKIWVESQPNKGSSFYFTHPYRIADSAIDDTKNNTKFTPTAFNWKGKSILIVEDDEASKILLQEILKKSGIKIYNSNSGETAIKTIQKNPEIDLVLMDVQLPGIQGDEAMKRIKATNGKVIIVAQTAFAMKGDREKYIEMGFNDYISKPLDPQVLLSVLDKLLNA